MPYPQRDNRGSTVTTWSFVERLPQEQQTATPTASPIPSSPGRRSATDPTNGGRRRVLHNPQAEKTGGLRRRGKITWGKLTSSGRKKNHQHDTETQVRNANLMDPALERNFRATPRPTSDLSDITAPRKTPPAKFAALHNQRTAPMPIHLSTATARTNAPEQFQFAYTGFGKPNRNDAMVLGNAPLIPTREGNCVSP